jgi:hypothetical protein
MSWKHQTRDSKGRFGKSSLPQKAYTIEDIKAAWLAGHNDRGMFLSITKKLQRYIDGI